MDPFMEGPDGGRCFMEMFQQRAQYTPILCPPPPPPPFHHVHHYPPFQNEAFPVPQPNSFFYNGTTYFYQPDQLQAPRGAEVEGVNGVQPGPEDLPIQAFQKLSMSNLYEEDRIRNVWSFNLYNEFRTIRSLLKQYHYVAMDTEFPGIVAFPIAKFDSNYEYQYQRLRANVDMLNIIQVGLTFFDEHGNSPPGISTWQFNFQFSLA
ncbi:unnamed protein product [Orchesella dallaii]|uniref:poly(A)-specific ribonuclease n=1 Tax=Orchesella dallaii TaxID=48710 RepID=A0ABP1QMZ6_9HEXA